MPKVRIISLYIMCLFSIYRGKSEADKNGVNLVKIKKGMKLEEVIKIMGRPDSILIEPEYETQDWYMYEAPDRPVGSPLKSNPQSVICNYVFFYLKVFNFHCECKIVKTEISEQMITFTTPTATQPPTKTKELPVFRTIFYFQSSRISGKFRIFVKTKSHALPRPKKRPYIQKNLRATPASAQKFPECTFALGRRPSY